MNKWAAYQADYAPGNFNFNIDDIPLTINSTWLLSEDFNTTNNDTDFQAVLLPDNRAGIQVDAYGISAGTNHPRLAYELLQYMTQTPEIAYAFFGDSPARRSLLTADTGDLPTLRDYSEEVQTLIDEALANAIPQSQLEFVRYINYATSQVNNEDEPVDAETALQDTQIRLTEVYLVVAEQADNNVVEVATPIPTPVLQSGEVALNFGVQSFFGSIEGNDIWQDAIDEFVMQDPQVGRILIDTGYYSIEEHSEKQDCFYLASNAVPTADLSLFYTVDPFLTTDPTLDIDNFVNGALDQVTRGCYDVGCAPVNHPECHVV